MEEEGIGIVDCYLCGGEVHNLKCIDCGARFKEKYNEEIEQNEIKLDVKHPDTIEALEKE